MSGTTTLKVHDPRRRNDLQRLRDANIDSSVGYRAAARRVSSPQLATAFREVAERRRSHADEIECLLPDVEADSGPSPGRWLRHWWSSVRSALRSGDKRVILARMARVDERLARVYADHVQRIDDSRVRAILDRHVEEVRDHRDEVAELRRLAAGDSGHQA